MNEIASKTPPPQENGNLKFLLDLGPLIVFFGVLAIWGILPATAALMVVTPVSIVASRIIFGKVSAAAIVTLVSVLFFGGLTMYFKDPTFIKIKVTIVNLLFAAILAGGFAFKKPLLKYLLGHAIQLKDEGWRVLTYRWIGFFLIVAALNEVIWRNFSDETWGAFKSFGVVGLTFVFFMSQISVIMKYQVAPATEGATNTQP